MDLQSTCTTELVTFGIVEGPVKGCGKVPGTLSPPEGFGLVRESGQGISARATAVEIHDAEILR